MRELDCDFCGATADGAYELLPPSLDPAPDEQTRLALCGGCRETLDGVVSPLLDRLEATAGDGAGSADASPSPGSDDGADPTAGGATSPTAGNGLDATPTSDPEPTVGSTPEPVVDSDPEPTSDAVPDTEQTAGDADAYDGSKVRGDDADGGGGGDARADEPEGFRTVMRLLNNREFPVDRAAVTELAAGAYEMEDDEVAAIIEYAVERGVLVEEAGRLDRA